MARKAIYGTLVVAFFILLGIAHTWPAASEVPGGGEIGIGGDEITMPYFIWWARQLAEISPAALLNGALYTPQVGYPEGNLIWMSYIERAMAIVTAPFANPKTTFWFFVLGFYVLAGSLMTALGRRLGFSWWVSLAMGVCLAFSPYMYWRSFQHVGLMGVFFLPLMGLAYERMHGRTEPKNLAIAAALMLLAGTTGHYLILVMLTLIPVMLGFLWWKTSWSRRFKIGLVFVPLALLLAWVRLIDPVGVSDLKTAERLYDRPRPYNERTAWDVLVYSAQPIDYLTGNFQRSSLDLNPARQWVTSYVREKHGNQFYPQEHATGIRWFLLVFFVLAIWQAKKVPPEKRKWIWLGVGMAVVAYVLSLSPRTIAPLGIGIGPSQWIHKLVPEMRAPNRWCVGVHFGVILAAMAWFSYWARNHRFRKCLEPGVLGLSLLSFLPTLQLPVRAENRAMPGADCGVGVVLPYKNTMELETYRLVSSLRFSDCKVLNGQQTPEVDQYFVEVFSNPGADARQLMDCLGVEWIRPATQEQCKSLGFPNRRGPNCYRDRPAQASTSWKSCLPRRVREARRHS